MQSSSSTNVSSKATKTSPKQLSKSNSSIEKCTSLSKHFRQLEQQQKRQESHRQQELALELKPKQTSNEPKLYLALDRDFSNYSGRELFIETDTPIFKLPTESMVSIFERCSSFEDYCQISIVCRKWRHLANLAFLVSIISYKYMHNVLL